MHVPCSCRTALMVVSVAITATSTPASAQRQKTSPSTYSRANSGTKAQSAPLSNARDTAGLDAEAAAGSDAGTAADTGTVRAVIQAVFKAAERQDIAALDTLYAGDSLTVIEGAGINRGWADYRDHHLVPELREMKGLEYQPEEIVVHIRGDMAWALFRYTLVAQSEGRTADVIGRGTAILERQYTPRGRRWVVRHIHTSGRARRPADPPRRPTS